MAGKKGEYELEIMISGETDRSLAASIQKARRELKSLERRAGLSSKGIEESFGGMSVKGIDALSGAADKVFGAMVKSAEAAGVGIVAALGLSTMVGQEFESQMSTVAAISQASSGEMKQLKDIAKEMGRSTKFSASEAGQGLEYMAMAGWKTQDMIAGLPGVVNLAAASGEDLGLVSDILTDAMTAFGLSADQSGHFADVLAQASSNSNTNVAMMGETFRYVAPVAGSFGFTIEDTATAIGLMANSGIKASNSGTALRKILTGLGEKVELTGRKFGKLTVRAANSDGSMRSLRDIVVDLRNGFEEMTESERNVNAEAIAGKTGMAGLLAIVNASEKDFNKLTEAIDNSTGASKRMEAIRLDNLAGDATILKSGLEGAGIEIYEGMSDILRSGVQTVTSWVSTFTESLQENIPAIRREAKAFAQGLEQMFGPLLDAGKWFLDHPAVITGSINGIAAALLTFKAAKGVASTVKLFGTLSGMVSAWPVAAAGLVIGGIVGICSAMNRARKDRAAQDLSEHFGDITLSLEELNEAARSIVGGELSEALEIFGEVSNASSELQQAMKKEMQEINKYNWKLSLDMKLDEGETQAYVKTIDSYVKNALDLINNREYEIKLATNIIFGEDANTSESDIVYEEINRIVTALQSNLNENLNDIVLNGLTLPKEEIVQGYLKDIAEITQMITDAENAAKLQLIQGEFAGVALTSDSFQNLQQAIGEYTEEANAGADEAYQKILTNLNMQRLAGERGMKGGITEEEFNDRSAEAATKWYEHKAETILNGYQIMEDTIMATYGSEIAPAMETINQSLNESLNAIFESPNISNADDYVKALNAAIDQALNSVDISDGTKDAIAMLLEGMAPTQQQISDLTAQITQAGEEVPEAFQAALTNMGTMGAAAGEKEDLWTIIGRQVANSPERALLLETVRQQSGQIPEAGIEAIRGMYPEAEEAARGFLNAMRNQFNDGLSVQVPVNIDTIMKSDQGQSAMHSFKRGVNLPGHAEGGIFDTPHIAEFAEDGPEAVVPLDGSKRAIELWQETGRLLGMYQERNYNNFFQTLSGTQGNIETNQTTGSGAPTFTQTINIYGNADKDEVGGAAQKSFEQFKEWFLQFRENEMRTSF